MVQSAGDDKLEAIEVERSIHGREAKLIWFMVAVKILTDQPSLLDSETSGFNYCKCEGKIVFFF